MKFHRAARQLCSMCRKRSKLRALNFSPETGCVYGGRSRRNQGNPIEVPGRPIAPLGADAESDDETARRAPAQPRRAFLSRAGSAPPRRGLMMILASEPPMI